MEMLRAFLPPAGLLWSLQPVCPLQTFNLQTLEGLTSSRGECWVFLLQ